MKKFIAMSVFVLSSVMFVHPAAGSASTKPSVKPCQGSGCVYVCRQELRRCRLGNKACKRQYKSCVRGCPR
ncbi:MAG: hypothetical protein IPI64_05370 [Chloracidobacterium sp.]|nr:hypothetical protein [Chloracidobacterium sp.]